MEKFALRLAVLMFALWAGPASAAGEGAQVPEASAMTLFALGVLGVIVGRRGAMRPKKRDENEADRG